MRIGLLGGSFNPAHAGHRAISLCALKSLGLDQVWWLVSPQNPLKPVRGMASLPQRLQSAERAMGQHPRVQITALEQELGTRYSVDTLRKLQQRFGRTQFVWLMGADNMEQMARWRRWPQIFAMVPVAVFRRPTYAAGRSCGKAAARFETFRLPANAGQQLVGHKTPAWLVMENQLQFTSSTEIRKDLTTWPK